MGLSKSNPEKTKNTAEKYGRKIWQKSLKNYCKNGKTMLYYLSSRECWNWQTGKTKDLVGVCSCGFKSHLPQMQKWRNWQTRTVQVRVVATPCGFDSHLLHERPKSFEKSGV